MVACHQEVEEQSHIPEVAIPYKYFEVALVVGERALVHKQLDSLVDNTRIAQEEDNKLFEQVDNTLVVAVVVELHIHRPFVEEHKT
ncbi:hypothetical protein D3C80_2034640 [compost metagenome]